jgi:hypothetical protein
MATTPTDPPQCYLRTREAARFVGLCIGTLEKHRIYGTGPRYSKLGGRVVYSVEDLQTWVESGTKSSTSDPGVATVRPAKRQSPLAPPPIRPSDRRSSSFISAYHRTRSERTGSA